jgi:hypothetical protein
VSYSRGDADGGAFVVSIDQKGFEMTRAEGEALLQPMVAFAASFPPAVMAVHTAWSYWNYTGWTAGQPFPWTAAPTNEFSASILESYARYPTTDMLATDEGIARVQEALFTMTSQLPTSINAGGFKMDHESGQAAAGDTNRQRFMETSQNPIALNALGIIYMMISIPSLPQLPPSVQTIRELWPRLRDMAVTRASNPDLYAVCELAATEGWLLFYSGLLWTVMLLLLLLFVVAVAVVVSVFVCVPHARILAVQCAHNENSVIPPQNIQALARMLRRRGALLGGGETCRTCNASSWRPVPRWNEHFPTWTHCRLMGGRTLGATPMRATTTSPTSSRLEHQCAPLHFNNWLVFVLPWFFGFFFVSTQPCLFSLETRQ